MRIRKNICVQTESLSVVGHSVCIDLKRAVHSQFYSLVDLGYGENWQVTLGESTSWLHLSDELAGDLLHGGLCKLIPLLLKVLRGDRDHCTFGDFELWAD